jgi:hypothetical protein
MTGRINTQNLGSGKWCSDMKTNDDRGGCETFYSMTSPGGNFRYCYNSFAPSTSGTTFCSESDMISCQFPPPAPPAPPAPHTCALREGRINTQNLGSGKFCYDILTTNPNTCDGLYSQTLNGNTRVCYNPIAPATDPATACSEGDLLVCAFDPPSPPPPLPPTRRLQEAERVEKFRLRAAELEAL